MQKKEITDEDLQMTIFDFIPKYRSHMRPKFKIGEKVVYKTTSGTDAVGTVEGVSTLTQKAGKFIKYTMEGSEDSVYESDIAGRIQQPIVRKPKGTVVTPPPATPSSTAAV